MRGVRRFTLVPSLRVATSSETGTGLSETAYFAFAIGGMTSISGKAPPARFGGGADRGRTPWGEAAPQPVLTTGQLAGAGPGQHLLLFAAPIVYARQVIFEQFYLSCLAHASYLIGSEGIAAVVDPQRDVGIYLETAQQHGLRIAYIIETHLHADFVSGHQELAQRTGATICLGEGAGAAVHCKSGYRSAIACSLLQAHGFGRVMNVRGGLDAWIVSSAGGLA